VLKSLDDFLACRDCINDFPLYRFGGGSLIGNNSAAHDTVIKEAIINATVPVKNDFLNIISPPYLLKYLILFYPVINPASWNRPAPVAGGRITIGSLRLLPEEAPLPSPS
jgi:hypothetical protein